MFTTDNFDDIENLVFFDIDQTLSDSISHCFTNVDDILALKQELKNDGFKRVKAIDVLYLSKTSLQLFAELLKVKGTKAICISSWAMVKEGYVIDEIDTLFNRYADFPDNWLVGLLGGGGGDRVVDYVLPFVEKHNFKGNFVVIDDGGGRYSRQDIVVNVDGRLSYNIYDFVRTCDILNIQSVENEKLNYHLQYIRGNK